MSPGIHVLHVDDDPDFAQVTADFLERLDDELVVETAVSPREGVSRVEEGAFDCIVSDYEMPEMSGLDFLDAVRADHPDLPFILFTGKGDESVASRAISAGVSDYLPKATSSEQYELLAARIRSHVERTRAQQDRLRHLDAIESAQEGISILDQDGRFQYVNEAYAELYGYEPAELVGEHWEIIYPEGHSPRIREEVLPTVAEDGIWHGETTGLRADGSTFTEEHTLASTADDGLVCTVRDATERKEREQQLKRQKTQLEAEIERRKAAEQRYRSLFDNNPIIIWEQDYSASKQYLDDLTDEVDDITAYFDENPDAFRRVMEGVEVLDVNKTAVEYYGAPSKDQLLDNFERVMAEEAWDVATELWESVARGEAQFRSETVARTFDGERRHQILDLYIPGADEGDYSRVYMTGTDITERKEREQTLTALHEAAQDIGEASDDGTVYETLIETAEQVLDFDLVVVDVEHDGYLVQEAWTLDAEDGDYWERTSLEADDSFAVRAYNEQETIVVNDPDESDIDPADSDYQSALTVPIGRFGTFQAVASQSAAFDDHDIAFAELLVDHARVKLSQLAGRQELEARTAELERQNERLDEFASFVSHDLRNPLNVANLRLDLLAEETDSDHLADIEHALSRMEQLIEDLLTLTRQDQTVGETHRIPLASFSRDCWETVDTADATLTCTTDRTLRANRNRLRSVFENLFGNAIEHGGDDVTVTVGALDDGFYVADDGVGIPADRRDQVFDRGYSTGSDGTGLGLVIVREIVDAHGWEIAVTESERGGACFEITGVEFSRT